ncbi:MAG: serine/threonine-protein kinase, partial [Planctomycetota bacterium]
MHTLKISSDGRLCAVCKVPDSYRDVGCVVLLDRNRLVELNPLETRHCGAFELQLADMEAAEAEYHLAQSGHGSSTVDVTVHGLPSEDPSTKNISRISQERAASTADGLPESIHGDPISDVPRVPIEIYPRIDGYELKSMLGRGGMGTVWLAKQLSTNREVALKTILPSIIGLSKTRIRFQREIELAAGLNHPGLDTIFTSGETLGHCYYSMELVDGVSWSQHVRQHDPSHKKILTQLQAVLEAIGYAHDHDVIHRDLKPSNILIHQDGSVRVVDFGLAKHREESSEKLSEQGDIIGTLAFMAPEQASGNVQSIDSRADIYALGVVALSFLTRDMSNDAKLATSFGRAETQSTGQTQETDVDGNLLSDSPVAPYCTELQRRIELLRIHLPLLADVIEPAVAATPNDRYATCDQFRGAIKDYVGSSLPNDTAPTPSISSRRRWWVVAAATIAMALSWFIYDRNQSGTPVAISNRESNSIRPNGESAPLRQQILDDLASQFQADFEGFSSLPAHARVTRAIGGKRPATDFILHPDGWPLVGFCFCTYRFRGDDIIKCIQPVFRDWESNNEETGPLIGILDQGCVVHKEIAAEGYAVSALQVRWGSRIHGMRIQFARLEDGRLDLNDTHESDWYGGKVEMAGQSIASDGTPVVGIHFAHN